MPFIYCLGLISQNQSANNDAASFPSLIGDRNFMVIATGEVLISFPTYIGDRNFMMTATGEVAPSYNFDSRIGNQVEFKSAIASILTTSFVRSIQGNQVNLATDTGQRISSYLNFSQSISGNWIGNDVASGEKYSFRNKSSLQGTLVENPTDTGIITLNSDF